MREWRIARACAAAMIACAGLAASPAMAGELEDVDKRTGTTAPTAAQERAATEFGGTVRWNRFGTPQSVLAPAGVRVDAASAEQAARKLVNAHRSLFRVDAQDLQVRHAERFAGTQGYAVVLRQSFGGVPAGIDGLLSVGLKGSRSAGWELVYASSSLTGADTLSGERRLSAREAWARAAADVGRGVSLAQLGQASEQGGWTTFRAPGFSQVQRAREVAVPTYTGGVRRAYETLVTDVAAGQSTAYTSYVDAETGAVLVRNDNVHESHEGAETFQGSLPAIDAACETQGPWTVADGERVESIAVTVSADLAVNDVVVNVLRDGTSVASADTLSSPEIALYDPADAGTGTYTVEVCDFADGAGWTAPATYSGSIVFNGAAGPGAADPYPPKWNVFSAYPGIGGETAPHDYPSTDSRDLWCWESTGAECDEEVGNLASRAPWDADPRTGRPTFTTKGNNASTAEAWTTPLTPGAAGQRPVSPARDYDFPWTNAWFTSRCAPTSFTPGGNDIDAAVTNLFAMHNRMHDWTYHLGFTERRWNAQEFNFGTGNTAEGDPVIGNAQAGAASGGFPSYLGRDNANMISLPDGVPPITNMYLWQPIAGAFYAPCVDGDYDMAVIGHEYGHMVENRLIGKGGSRSGHHAGAMGESSGDLMGVEILNEYGYVPVSGENPFAVGAYVTGNKDRAIRSYGMNFPRTGAFPTPSVSLVKAGGPLANPLNFSNMGFDITGPQVHADGEIWSATNYDIRQALVTKFGAGTPQEQRDCAEGRLPADRCPGNRRWVQLMFDAYVLMPSSPSMLDARDAYLAADRMRFGGANQAELWLAFARRGFGAGAASSNTTADTDTDPTPDFASPLGTPAQVTFRATAVDEGNAPVQARFHVGHYEARTSPIADTNPATTGANLDDRAAFAPGEYEFVVQAPGYGHVRLRRSFAAGQNVTLTVPMRTNRASSAKGASATGDGSQHAQLIDDTEATSWDRTGAQPDVRGSQVTVDLQGARQTIRRAQVSALLEVGQNRFTALRRFRLDVSEDGTTFRPHYTSPADAFPGFNPRPVAPEMILREFTFPAVQAVAVRIVVLDNQCTGNPAFQGDQDADPASGSDCREGSPGGGPVPVFGDLPQVLAPRDNEVHIAELEVFTR